MWSKPGVHDPSPLSPYGSLACSERGKPRGINPQRMKMKANPFIKMARIQKVPEENVVPRKSKRAGDLGYLPPGWQPGERRLRHDAHDHVYQEVPRKMIRRLHPGFSSANSTRATTLKSSIGATTPPSHVRIRD